MVLPLSSQVTPGDGRAATRQLTLTYDKQASLPGTELDPPAVVHTTGLVRTLPARPGGACGYFTQQRPDETQCHVKASHLPEFPGSSTFSSAPPLPSLTIFSLGLCACDVLICEWDSLSLY